MGAGNAREHYIQDAAEAYVVYLLQLMAVQQGRAISLDVEEKKLHFEQYCEKRDIVDQFKKSPYKTNVDAILCDFFSALLKKYPDQSFDFIDVEAQYRNIQKKGDFLIKMSDGNEVSVSLKNYKKGYSRIQLCSGTWLSFLTGCMFKSAGVGTYYEPGTDIKFSSRHHERRNFLLEQMGYGNLLADYEWLAEQNNQIRAKYAYGPEASNWNNIKDEWKKDCTTRGHAAAVRMQAALEKLPEPQIRQRIMKMAGLDYQEELLLIGPKGKYLCSFLDDRYAEILRRINSENCRVTYKAMGQSLKFCFVDDEGKVVSIEMPFTLQANGAWHRPSNNKYSGTQYHAKENKNLFWGDRRPKKSKELATSINTYFKLGAALNAVAEAG